MTFAGDVVTGVKNTFIELSFKRTEKKRTRTIPSNFKFHGITYDLEPPESCVDVATEYTTSTTASPRSRTSSGRSTPSTKTANSRQGVEDGDDVLEMLVRARPRPWWFGRVWKLARDKHGCRQLQSALDVTSDEDEKIAILLELHGHVQEACRCPNANYVLQKFISMMAPINLQFILEEITSKGPRAASMVARHKYGCRIIQRLFEQCPQGQTMELAEYLLVQSEACLSCLHEFGNYAMQHLYQYGTASQRQRLVLLLVHEVHKAKDGHLCTVIGKVLASGDRGDQKLLSKALQAVPGLLETMTQTKSGQFAANLACQILSSR